MGSEGAGRANCCARAGGRAARNAGAAAAAGPLVSHPPAAEDAPASRIGVCHDEGPARRYRVVGRGGEARGVVVVVGVVVVEVEEEETRQHATDGLMPLVGSTTSSLIVVWWADGGVHLASTAPLLAMARRGKLRLRRATPGAHHYFQLTDRPTDMRISSSTSPPPRSISPSASCPRIPRQSPRHPRPSTAVARASSRASRRNVWREDRRT